MGHLAGVVGCVIMSNNCCSVVVWETALLRFCLSLVLEPPVCMGEGGIVGGLALWADVCGVEVLGSGEGVADLSPARKGVAGLCMAERGLTGAMSPDNSGSTSSSATYSGAKKYLVSHQLCKFSHLKRWERPVIFIIDIPQLWETK